MNNTSKISKLSKYPQLKYDLVLLTANQDTSQALTINEPLTEQEATYFIIGLQNNLFSIDDQGYVQSPFLPDPPTGTQKQKMIQLFWNHGGGKRRLYREGVNQLATASRLIYEFGWDVQDIKMEPSIAEFGDCAYGVDMLLLGPDGSIPFCCENKSSTKEFDKLIRQFKSCCFIGAHEKSDCEEKANHGKYRFCLNAKPKFFWAVSPQVEAFYELSYKNGGVIQVTELPTPLNKDEVLTR